MLRWILRLLSLMKGDMDAPPGEINSPPGESHTPG